MLSIFQIIFLSLVLIAGIPVGLFLAKITKQEKSIYKRYFPILLWILAIVVGVFYTLDLLVAVSLTFIFIMVLFWHHSDRFKKQKK